ncbi:MAG: hypothetical protein JWR54_612 [Mucilaginibacter sp.]|nr:hypothetical protein [Mucilaginibacter sp.]
MVIPNKMASTARKKFLEESAQSDQADGNPPQMVKASAVNG